MSKIPDDTPIVLATHNRNKVREFQRMIPDRQVLSMSDIGFHQDIPETGQTFEENAAIKANALHELLNGRGRNYIVVAEDSGLCVNALGGNPGVYTARYCGKDSSDQAKRDRLREELHGAKDRTAYYACALSVWVPCYDQPLRCSGTVSGEIIDEERGENGFAFDSIFYSPELGKTFGEATNEEKDSISHRWRAIQSLLEKLAAA